MTNEIFKLKRGLKARLEGIPGLRVITFEPEDWRDFPVAIIRTESSSASRAGVNGSRFEAEFVVTVMAGGSKRSESYDALDSYIATDGDMSVEAAIADDLTLGGVANWAHPVGVENIRIVRMGGGRYVAADFRIRVERRTANETLELAYGNEVIDLTGEPYYANGDVRFSDADRGPGDALDARAVEVELRMREAEAGQIPDGLSRLRSVCALAEGRSGAAWDSSVRLRHTRGDANVEYRTLRGRVETDPETSKDGPGLNAKLVLTIEALGRLASVEVSRTLSNEHDGTNLNYADITDIPGDHGALSQIKIHDPSGTWSGERRMWIGVKSGEGRGVNLFFQGESGSAARGETMFEEADAIWSGGVQPLTEASGGEYARMSWTKAGLYTTRSEFTLCGSVRITIAAPNVPRGRFRALARARTDSDNSQLQVGHLGFALGWSFGATSKTPVEADAVFPQTSSEFRVLDLGELTLPPSPVPEGYSMPAFRIDVYGVFAGGGAGSAQGTHHFRWAIDYVMLLPIDEGEVSVDAVGTTKRILVDTLTKSEQEVYLLDESDAVLGSARFQGTRLTIGPEDTRIYTVRDDAGDPSSVNFELTTLHTPLTTGV